MAAKQRLQTVACHLQGGATTTSTGRPVPAVGTLVADLDTPTLLIQLDELDYNIAYMAKFCREHGKLWRPHIKVASGKVLAAAAICMAFSLSIVSIPFFPNHMFTAGSQERHIGTPTSGGWGHRHYLR